MANVLDKDDDYILRPNPGHTHPCHTYVLQQPFDNYGDDRETIDPVIDASTRMGLNPQELYKGGSALQQPMDINDDYGFTKCDSSQNYLSSGIDFATPSFNGSDCLKHFPPSRNLNSPITKKKDRMFSCTKCKCNPNPQEIIKKELQSILQEIRVITDKFREEVTVNFHSLYKLIMIRVLHTSHLNEIHQICRFRYWQRHLKRFYIF